MCGISFRRSIRIELALEMSWPKVLANLQSAGEQFPLPDLILFFGINPSAQLPKEP